MPSTKDYPLEGTPYTVREFAHKFHLREEGNLIAEVPQLFYQEAENFIKTLRQLYKLDEDPQFTETRLTLPEAFETAKVAWRILDWMKINNRSYMLIDEIFQRETGEFFFDKDPKTIPYFLMFIRIAAVCGILSEYRMLVIVNVKFVNWIKQYGPDLNSMAKEGKMDLDWLRLALQDLYKEKVIITDD